MDLTFRPEPYTGPKHWGTAPREVLLDLLAEYEGLMRAMGTCCMTAEQWEHAKAVVQHVRSHLAAS